MYNFILMTKNIKALRVGFIGTGAICSLITREIESGKVGNVEILALYDTDSLSAKNLSKQLTSAPHLYLSLIHICRCRRSTLCRSRWSPYH